MGGKLPSQGHMPPLRPPRYQHFRLQDGWDFWVIRNWAPSNTGRFDMISETKTPAADGEGQQEKEWNDTTPLLAPRFSLIETRPTAWLTHSPTNRDIAAAGHRHCATPDARARLFVLLFQTASDA